MITVTDLPGRPGRFKAHHFRTVTGAVTLIRANKVASAAGHLGAITLYRDRAGHYRAHLSVYSQIVSELDCLTLTEVRTWLKVNLPLIGDQDRLARF